jgi:hypothetical protein
MDASSNFPNMQMRAVQLLHNDAQCKIAKTAGDDRRESCVYYTWKV